MVDMARRVKKPIGPRIDVTFNRMFRRARGAFDSFGDDFHRARFAGLEETPQIDEHHFRRTELQGIRIRFDGCVKFRPRSAAR